MVPSTYLSKRKLSTVKMTLDTFPNLCHLVACSSEAPMAKAETQMVTLRIPKDLHRKLTREAARRGQTLNAEVIHRLLASFEPARELRTLVMQKDLADTFMKAVREAAAEYYKTATELREAREG